jgi:quercetin dioxygenase-like cupin family protein
MREPAFIPWRRVCAGSLLLSALAACSPQVHPPNAAAGPKARTTCVDVPTGAPRPEFGCFNVATARGLRFSEPAVYWHLLAFRDRAAAEAAKSPMGLVIEEEASVWLSEFGPRGAIPSRGEAVAVVGPLDLPSAETFNVVLSYAVMRPGDRSMIHTHPGPEGWYLLAGEQCVQTPSGSKQAVAGETMTTPPDVPIELRVTGTSTRRALLVVIHDATKPRTIPSAWQPPARCGPE